MAVTSASFTPSSSAMLVASVDPTRRRIIFSCVSNPDAVWIGGPTVDDFSGVQLNPGDSLEIVQAHREDTSAQQEWYAFSNGASPVLAVVSVDN